MIVFMMTFILTQNDDHLSQFLYKEHGHFTIKRYEFQQWYKFGYKPVTPSVRHDVSKPISVICKDEGKYLEKPVELDGKITMVLMRYIFNVVGTAFIAMEEMRCVDLNEWSFKYPGDCLPDRRYHIISDWVGNLERVENHGILHGTGCSYVNINNFHIEDMVCVDSKLDIMSFEQKCPGLLFV